MTTTPVRLILAALACTLLAAAPPAHAASKRALYPSIAKVAPTTLGIGDTMTVTGKNFRKGKNKNTVVFKRDGGRAIFVRIARSTSTTKLSVKVPAKLLPYLVQKKGVAQPTRFRVRVLAARFGRAFTSLKKSPRIGPVAIGPKVSKDDCDGDGIDNATDKDDDNDLLSDSIETNIGTDACKRDTDGDGMSDGWEYQSALDRNNGRAAGAKPSPNRKPYANPLDKTDAEVDQDGDSLTNLMEYTAWATFSNAYRTAPAGGSVLTYSGGNPTSDGRGGVPANFVYADRDKNGFLSDFERDADGDGFPNMDEGIGSMELIRIGTLKADGTDPRYYDFGLFSQLYITKAAEKTKQDAAAGRCAGINQVSFYCGDQAVPTSIDVQKVDPLDWLATDTDGDGIRDDADDQDHDDVPNMQEYQAELAAAPTARTYQQLDSCIPNTESHFCILAGKNGDSDDDLIPNERELQIKTDPLQSDSDGDGVSDGFEYYSSRNLNPEALPSSDKRDYPNALDGTDANTDFDGDSLTLTMEYKAWRYTGGTLPLSYSDGLQRSGGQTQTDDQRDADGDHLTNYVEASGPLSGPEWWNLWTKKKSVKCSDKYVETTYPVKYLGLDFLKKDTDGDGIDDDVDDVDFDGIKNVDEISRPTDWCDTYVSVGPGSGHNAGDVDPAHIMARVNPFNPCKPVYSDTCHLHPPFGYYPDSDDYIEDWAGANPPA